MTLTGLPISCFGLSCKFGRAVGRRHVEALRQHVGAVLPAAAAEFEDRAPRRKLGEEGIELLLRQAACAFGVCLGVFGVEG